MRPVIPAPTGFDPYQQYPAFYNNPTIQTLAKRQRWTVSDNDKRPLHMHELEYHASFDIGASIYDTTSMRTLQDFTEILPTASNCTFFVDRTIDHIIIVDVDKGCPDDMFEKFLHTPYLYAELSRSNRGLHLIYPEPSDLFARYPLAAKRSVMKYRDWFEVMSGHFVTFTRNALAPSDNTQDLYTLIEPLFASQRETINFNIALDPNRPDALPGYEEIVDIVTSTPGIVRASDAYTYNKDLSRMEYVAALRTCNRVIDAATYVSNKIGYEYTTSDMVWIVYDILIRELEPRPKHKAPRGEVTWLMYTTQQAMAQVEQVRADKQAATKLTKGSIQ